MGDKTGIEWTDATWNPVTGCTKVSSGCKFCYAERDFHRPYPGRKFTDVQIHADRLDIPLRWRKPRKIFVVSMGDLFHETVPDDFIAAVFGIMAACPQHTFQILTKRPERMLAWTTWLEASGGIGHYIRSIRVDGDRAVPNLFSVGARTEIINGRIIRAGNDPWMIVFNAAGCCAKGPLEHVWLGVSAENQGTADERIPLLLQTPAAVRFVSYEPALGPVDIRQFIRWERTTCGVPDMALPAINWVIAGGESGPKARPSHPDWFRSVRDQCQAAGVPFFFKQWGEWGPVAPIYSDSDIYESRIAEAREFRCTVLDLTGHEWPEFQPPPESWMMERVGKKLAGRILFGREWSEFPAGCRCAS